MMEPFAYEKPKRPSRVWLAAGIVGIGFGIWHFDLVPRFLPVETGQVDAKLQSPAGAPMSAELWGDIVDHGVRDRALTEVTSDADPLLDAIAAPAETIEAAFPEFGLSADVVARQRRADERTTANAGRDLTPPEERSPAADVITDANIRQVGLTTRPEAPSSTVRAANFEKPAASPKPNVLPREVADRLKRVDALIHDDDVLGAHEELSRLYWTQPDRRPLLTDRIEFTAAEIYANPKRHLAEPYFVESGDTLENIARQYDVPWQYLAKLNRTSPQTLQAGQQLKVLRGPFGAVVDLSDFELTVHAHGWYVHRYRIGTGKGNRTPTGEFSVETKLENPTWYNPDGGTVDGDDPSNPLGEYWLGLGDHIGIHGTIDPDTIGRAASRGCIHLADGDISEVFHLLGVGSMVVIRE